MANTPIMQETVQMSQGSEDDAEMRLMDMLMSWIYPVALRTVVQLDVPHILATHAPTAMTAHEILTHIPEAATGQASAGNLERLLRLLTTKGVFVEDISENNNALGADMVVRRFSLTPLSRCLVPGHGTFRDTALFLTLGPEYSATLEYLGDSVLKSESPFTKAHGVNMYEYMKTHPALLEMFMNYFKEEFSIQISTLLSLYQGFESVHKLMDVGGGSGQYLASIVEKYPHIHAINFELPEVVANNPSLPGVEQVGGDMFEKLPTGCDAIFMKTILHNWNDERCLKILKNCFAALPSTGGKLIMMDLIIPKETPPEVCISTNNNYVFYVDLMMQIRCDSGRERTAIELEGLLKQAGFTNFQIVGKAPHYYIMEAFK